MRKSLIAILSLLSFTVSAQLYTPNGTVSPSNSSTNVGIGISSPRGVFDVSGASDIYFENNPVAGSLRSLYLPGHIYFAPRTGGDVVYIQARRPDNSGSSSFQLRTVNSGVLVEAVAISSGGNVGIGTTVPDAKLSVVGNISMPLLSSIGFGQSDRFSYDSKSIGNYTLGWYGDSQNTGAAMSYLSSYGGIKFFTQSSARVTITQNGNVGIGTTIPDTKLAVLGTIHSNEVKVDLNVPAPDYVFESAYQLPTLDELSTYIKVNKHLPEVPAACTMEENGVNLGEMNMLLLKKIEELTLYVIELKKQNDDVVKENQQQRQEINTLKKKVGF